MEECLEPGVPKWPEAWLQSAVAWLFLLLNFPSTLILTILLKLFPILALMVGVLLLVPRVASIPRSRTVVATFTWIPRFASID